MIDLNNPNSPYAIDGCHKCDCYEPEEPEIVFSDMLDEGKECECSCHRTKREMEQDKADYMEGRRMDEELGIL